MISNRTGIRSQAAQNASSFAGRLAELCLALRDLLPAEAVAVFPGSGDTEPLATSGSPDVATRGGPAGSTDAHAEPPPGGLRLDIPESNGTPGLVLIAIGVPVDLQSDAPTVRMARLALEEILRGQRLIASGRHERERAKLARADARRKASEIRRQRRLLDQTSRLARVGAWEYDVARRILNWSPEIYRILDLDPSEKPLFEDVPRFYREDVRPAVVAHIKAALHEGRPFESEFPVVTATGRHRRIRFVCEALTDKGRVSRLIGTVQDVSEQRAKEEEVTFIATHDVMTGLPNRAVFRERLDAALAAPEGAVIGRAGLILMDIDHFKNVNDTLGHHAGDVLLTEVARRLVRAAGGRGLAARLGGDEFALLVPGPVDPLELDVIGRRVMDEFVQPVIYGEESIPVTASVGLALAGPYGTPEDLLKDADIALYEAKNAGRNRAVAFDRSMREEMELRQTILRAVRTALDHDEMILHYQPKVNLTDGSLFGFEALLRWQRADGFVAGPSFFGVALDDPHLSRVIGDLVIERAVAMAADWHRRGHAFGHIAINVATSQFRRGDLADLVLSTLRRHDAPPDRLIVEVTENVLLSRDADEVRVTLERLSEAGVKIALDDFGTGYASLTHLKEFPVDLLKIDRSFVSTLHEHRESQAIVRSITGLARDLDIAVIAEGIETVEQEDLVRRLGATIGQGYRFARPMAAADAEARWLGGADGLSRSA